MPRRAPPASVPTPAPPPAPTDDRPDLSLYPAGSVLHEVRIGGRSSWTVLTGWRHLLAPNEDEKKDKGMVTAECGDKGRPYVWKGVGIRVTTISHGVTCPRCLKTPRYAKLAGMGRG